MSRTGSPPRLAAWLVANVVQDTARDAVLGDLDERYRVRHERDGRWRARLWYWRQTLSFMARVPASRAARRLNAVMEGDTSPRNGHGRVAGAVAADIRFALRSLRRRPGLSVASIAILALAVGANTTVFGVVKAILIERLPFPSPDRLVMLWDRYPQQNTSDSRMPITRAHYQAWSEQTDVFSEIGAWESTSPAISHGEWPERIDAALVTATLLPMLGARPILGRLFAPDDEAAGAEPVVILSHAFWATRFDADPGIIDRTIDLNGRPVRVIGVTASDFWFYDPYAVSRSLGGSAESARLWLPLTADAFDGESDYPRYRVIARLRDGIAFDAAAAAAAGVRPRLPSTTFGDNGEVQLVALSEQVVAEARPRLVGLFGAVSLVLLIACVNLVSLLLVHIESRRSEFAVRVALGAGRGRLTGLLVAESTMLALAGGLAGLLVSAAATSWLLDLVPRGLPLAHRVALDTEVALFGTGLAVTAGLVIGLLAAWRVDPAALAGTIRSGSRAVAGSLATRRLHGSLVAVEVALSLTLLISATLLLRSLVSLNMTDTGFDAEGVLTFEAAMPASPDAPTGVPFLEELETRLSDIPGVIAVGGTSALPFSRWAQSAVVEVAGSTACSAGPGNASRRIPYRFVSPGYFAATGLPVRAGRVFDPGDRTGARPVAIVNERFVEECLGGNAIGRSITTTFRETAARTVVGVVANVKHNQLYEAEMPIVYVPARQGGLPFLRFAVRLSAGDPMSLVEPIRRVAAGIDPDHPLQNFIAFDDLIAQSIEEERFYAQILGAFALAALVLTLIGIYGVVSYATRQRDREVGIRMALGAGAGRVRRLVLGQGLLPVVIGLGMGSLGGLATTGLLRGLLHGIAQRDPAVFIFSVVVFATVAAAACLIPASRAARVDPVTVLRGE